MTLAPLLSSIKLTAAGTYDLRGQLPLVLFGFTHNIWRILSTTLFDYCLTPIHISERIEDGHPHRWLRGLFLAVVRYFDATMDVISKADGRIGPGERARSVPQQAGRFFPISASRNVADAFTVPNKVHNQVSGKENRGPRASKFLSILQKFER